MAQSTIPFQFKGDFIDGNFVIINESTGERLVKSPADTTDALGILKYSYSSIESAISSATRAYKKWKYTRLEDRVELIRQYRSCLEVRKESWISLCAREVGKPTWEAENDFAALIQQIEVYLNQGLAQIHQGPPGVRSKPIGIIAVVTPFSSPGIVPQGFILSALLAGNVVIFKPSEKAAALGQWLVEAFGAAGFPGGVIQMIQGEAEIGRRLCVHESINGVLFSGSYEVGNRLRQDTLPQSGKLLVLEMGGKNSVLVWKDADVEVSVNNVLRGAFQSAGQNCAATSRVFVHQDLLGPFLKDLHEKSKRFSIGKPIDNPFMGPLIESGAVDRYLKYLGVANREGFEWVMRGKPLENSSYAGNYVTPSICYGEKVSIEQMRKSVYLQSELFSPNICIMGISDLDEAIACVNGTQYGLISSVFTRDRAVYDKFWNEVDSGMIYWNQSTTEIEIGLPRMGLKKSGNHFSTGISSIKHCQIPVVTLESEWAKNPSPAPQ